MKRLDKLENRTILVSVIFLLYSMATAFIIGYVATEYIMSLVVGVICYIFGFILSLALYRHKIK